MARPTTLPQQAIDNAAAQAQPHLPTELPPEHDALVAASRPTTLPQQAIDNAAAQAQPHLPTELPPEHDAKNAPFASSRQCRRAGAGAFADGVASGAIA
jgi:hypothetical protein